MNAETLSKAFEPFFTTKPVGAGTGLGLSMVYGFVKQSGGQVKIHSQEGKGTQVYLQLPYRSDDVEVPTRVEANLAPEAMGSGQTVLVVDDEPSVRMFVTEALGSGGYRVIEAGDAGAGLQILQSDTPVDLLVTDIGLPGAMDGRQMAQAGRRCRPDLAVLLMTGYTDPAVVGNPPLEPSTAVLTKPFTLNALISSVKLLSGKGRQP